MLRACLFGAIALGTVGAIAAVVGYEFQEKKTYDMFTHLLNGLLTGVFVGAILGGTVRSLFAIRTDEKRRRKEKKGTVGPERKGGQP